MNPKEFYIVLPSNSIRKDNLDNYLWNFRTYLPDPVTLSNEKWEVGLIEIVFPNTWTNKLFEDDFISYRHFSEEDNPFLRKRTKRAANNTTEQFYESRIYLKNYVIQSEYDIQNIFSMEKPDWFRGNFNFSLNSVHVDLGPQMGLKFSKNLSKLLNLQQNIWRNKKQNDWDGYSQKSNYPFDFSQNLNFMFIYSNIIKYTFVGNNFVPLLRCIPLHYTNDPQTHIKFDLPFYFSLDKNIIEYIDIEIRSSLGDLLKFDSGEIILTLHFRKKMKYGSM